MSTDRAYYGYHFTNRNSGGLGAILHDVMIACKYAHENNLIFAFVAEGYDIPRLNGSIDDCDLPKKAWHSYFTSFQVVPESACIEIWPTFLPNSAKPTAWNKHQFHDLLTDHIYHFHPTVAAEIEAAVQSTPFCAETDLVLHIRRTDKITEVREFVPIETYIKECEHVLEVDPEIRRIYICTDDQEVCRTIREHFDKKNMETIWDDSESPLPLQELRWNHRLEKSAAQSETMNAFKNLDIMRRAKHLVGGRMSYFFRIGELLGFPNRSYNIQDNHVFGIAEYSEVNYPIRPYMTKCIPDIIRPLDTALYQTIYKETGIVTIPDFVTREFVRTAKDALDQYIWWVYAIHPGMDSQEPEYRHDITEEVINKSIENLEQGRFCYRFRRTYGEHYATCTCISCQIDHTMRSFPMTDVLCQIVGCRHLLPGEIFISRYTHGDFLSVHHDIKKGDISVTISLTEDWNPAWGGVLHFVDKNIYKSVLPEAGSLTIFRLDETNGLDHFVSAVGVRQNRYTITAWYRILDK